MMKSWSVGVVAIISFLCSFSQVRADGTSWITYQSSDGDTLYLENNRRPALYTGNFGDCMGGSAINVTRFDAAYYQDNMTVVFHLAGNSGIRNDSLMMYIGVFAYGESRFDLVFNPCSANIYRYEGDLELDPDTTNAPVLVSAPSMPASR